LILSRPNGLIIRSAGALFALPPPSANTVDSEDTTKEDGAETGEEEEKVMPTTSQLARNYAKAAVRMVDAVGADVRELGEEQNVSLYPTYCSRCRLIEALTWTGRFAIPSNSNETT